MRGSEESRHVLRRQIRRDKKRSRTTRDDEEGRAVVVSSKSR
jgi:hypothetical protein